TETAVRLLRSAVPVGRSSGGPGGPEGRSSSQGAAGTRLLRPGRRRSDPGRRGAGRRARADGEVARTRRGGGRRAGRPGSAPGFGGDGAGVTPGLRAPT